MVQTKRKLDISIVIPVFNEQDNLILLHKKISSVFARLKKSYEIIFIDDGSSDSSIEKLRIIKKQDNKVKVIVFRKNFGQSAAISAGFSNSVGEVVIVMDADLQNDPEDIPKLLGKMREGFDVVSGWRYNREDPLSKKIPSKISNWMHKRLTGIKIHDSGCTLKAYSKESIQDLELYGEMHRYIPALISSKGFKIGELKVQHHKREHGKSKYGGGRLIRGFLDLIYIYFLTKYTLRPLHFFGYLGVIPIILGFLIGFVKIIHILYQILLLGTDFFVTPLLLLAVFLIIIGVQIIIFGFLAELIIRVNYKQTKTKIYSIKEIIN